MMIPLVNVGEDHDTTTTEELITFIIRFCGSPGTIEVNQLKLVGVHCVSH